MIWRLGRKDPHHVYAQRGNEPSLKPWPDGDRPVATFHEPADARLAVEAVNTYLASGDGKEYPPDRD